MFKLSGVGAENYGPPAPTVTQQAGQAVTDISRSVESMTGISNFPIYLGIALVGYVAYQYMNESKA